MIYQAAFIALVLATGASAAQAAPPILPGDYVREGYQCRNAPFAALMRFDGAAFSGPHDSDCTSRVISHSGWRFRLETTCRAAGDGTPQAPTTEVQSVVVLSPSRFSFSHGDGNAAVAIFNRCSKGFGDAAVRARPPAVPRL